MSGPLLETRDRRGVVTLTIDRPVRRNALDMAVIDAMTEAFARVEADVSVRAVVIAGTGLVFCAGVDFDWLRRAQGQDEAANRTDSDRLAAMYHAVDACTRPVVARVQGGAWAGGCSLLAACDVVVAGESARFAITEARIGLTPSLMLPYMMGRVGLRQVRRYCLTGEVFDAATARRINLASSVAPDAELDSAVAGIVDALLHCAPDSLVQTKALVREWTRPPVTVSVIALSAGAFTRGRGGDEAREGLAARAAGQPPQWATSG
ncbi:MAG: enoyl-CoA hydratase-related protein [Alphaproteobacteria bacterium]